jgi:peptidoglycan/LPS O-acetylase OafA/YrhL
MSSSHLPAARLRYLDGLRGLAILLVIMFHAYSRWPRVVPYHDRFAELPLFECGWVGVQLFFLISGFVILMTVERCRSFGEFMWKRWLRLFPAMLLCSLLVYLSAPLVPERPFGQPALGQLLAGLLFVDPDSLAFFTRHHFGVIEGSFWSLFVEVKFYLLFGALYFVFGARRAVAGLVAVFAAWAACDVAALEWPAVGTRVQPVLDVLNTWGARHYGWFAAGALYYRHLRGGRRGLPWEALALSALSTLSLYGMFGLALRAFAAGAAVSGMFALALLSPAVQQLLALRLLVFVGVASYPLYLMHENLMVALIVKLGAGVPGLPGILLPVLPVAGLTVVAWWVATQLEPRLRGALQELVSIPRRCAALLWRRSSS